MAEMVLDVITLALLFTGMFTLGVVIGYRMGLIKNNAKNLK
jgi:hypothetical protein